MKVLQFVAVLVLMSGFSYWFYTTVMKYTGLTPEQRNEVIRAACAANEISGDECLKYIESRLY